MSKQNGPPFGGPFFVELGGLISWPVRAPEPGLAQGREPAQVPGRAQALGQVPERVQALARPEPEQAPVCWRPAARRAPRGVRHFFRIRSRRRWPG